MIQQLEKSFQDYYYNDKEHSYLYLPTNRRLTSVTQFISQLKPKFDSELWSTIKAFEQSGYQVKRNFVNTNTIYVSNETTESTQVIIGFDDLTLFNLKVNPDEIKKQWDLESFMGTERGTYLHNYLENLDKRQLDTPIKPNIMISKHKPTTEQTIIFYNSLKEIEELAIRFKQENKHLIPICVEYVIGSATIGIAGKFDRLYFNEQTNEFEIWDFKTDKRIDTTNKYQKINLFNVHDCNFEKYSIQTSLYKYIIESETKTKLGKSNIVWFDYKNKEYTILETEDYTSKINDLKNEYSWSTYIKY